MDKEDVVHIHNGILLSHKKGGGKDWEFGISRCKLLYIGWINHKVLLYNTGNYI